MNKERDRMPETARAVPRARKKAVELPPRVELSEAELEEIAPGIRGKQKVCGCGIGVIGASKSKPHIMAELDAVAEGYAETAQRDLMHIHRGSLKAAAGIWVIYGNDGYDNDRRAQMEARIVKAVADSLARNGCTGVSGIRTSKDGGTWAVAVETDARTAEMLEAVAWAVWVDASLHPVVTSAVNLF